MTAPRSIGCALLLLLALASGPATALSAEGDGKAPPKKTRPPGPPPAPKAEDAGEGRSAPPKGEWTDTAGIVPEEWGWGGRVVLSWVNPELRVSPLGSLEVDVLMENKGPGTATIPWTNGYLYCSFGIHELAYEGRVKVEGRILATSCWGPAKSTTLKAGETSVVRTLLLNRAHAMMPGIYTLSLYRPKEAIGEGTHAPWRVLPPLRIEVQPAASEVIAEVVRAIEGRKSWRDVLLLGKPFDLGSLGDIGDARLLPPLEAIVRELEEIMVRDPDGPALALRDARWALAKTKVLLALAAGKDDEVGAFLEAKQPDDREGGRFKAMLRARRDVLKKGR